MLVDIGFFDSIKRANRRMNKLGVRMFGHAFLNGSWHCVYFLGTPFGRNMVQHHAEVSAIKWALDADEFQRWGVEGEADGKVVIGGRAWLLENDRDTENDKAVKARVAKLAATGLSVLWVAPTERRIRELIRLCGDYAEHCMYATLGQVLEDPHAEGAWHRNDGHVSTLPGASSED